MSKETLWVKSTKKLPVFHCLKGFKKYRKECLDCSESTGLSMVPSYGLRR